MSRFAHKSFYSVVLLSLLFVLVRCGGDGGAQTASTPSDGNEAEVVSLNSDAMLNPAAYIRRSVTLKPGMMPAHLRVNPQIRALPVTTWARRRITPTILIC
ncbi:MAG: hypothetical protein AB7U63_17120, partial [Porticoccaceae bacterium]